GRGCRGRSGPRSRPGCRRRGTGPSPGRCARSGRCGGVIAGFGKGPAPADALVERADGEQPGVAGQLARRRLENARRAKKTPGLGARRLLSSWAVSLVVDRTWRLNRLDARGRYGFRRPPRTAGRRGSAGPARLPGVPMSDVTQILHAIAQGDPSAASQLLP